MQAQVPLTKTYPGLQARVVEVVVVVVVVITGFVAQYELQVVTHVVAEGKLLVSAFKIYLLRS